MWSLYYVSDPFQSFFPPNKPQEVGMLFPFY